MAAPLRWSDDLVRAGWLPHLSGAGVKLILALGLYWFSKRGDARVTTARLVRITGLSRSSVYEARHELIKAGLIVCLKDVHDTPRGPREIVVYRLSDPMPSVPIRVRKSDTNQPTVQKSDLKVASAIADTTGPPHQTLSVRPSAQANSETPRLVRHLVKARTTDKYHRSSNTESIVMRLFQEVLRLRTLPQGTGSTVWRLTQCRPHDDDIRNLTRRLQSAGHRVFDVKVRKALTVAGDPFVQTATQLFDGKVVEVRDL